MLVCREDVAQVGSVDDVLKSRKNPDPDWRPVFGRNKSERVMSNSPAWWHGISLPAGVEKNQPTNNREEWQKELSRDWEKERNR